MAARRYEIYLRVVKKISRVSKANEYIIGIESGNQENNKLYSAQDVSHPRFTFQRYYALLEMSRQTQYEHAYIKNILSNFFKRWVDRNLTLMSDNEVAIYERKPCKMLLEALSTKSVAAPRQNWFSKRKLTN